MPSRNRIKQYVPGDYYHIYNRGVEKRLVFMDEQDYRVFLGYLKLYLLPDQPYSKPHRDLSREVELGAYCLMPNHYHLLVRQITGRGMESLMRCLITNYVLYFNKRHGRVGALFQDTYKAVRICDNEQLFQIEQYIHANPASMVADVANYRYSSLFMRDHLPQWIKPPKRHGASFYLESMSL